ncbi:DJ-1/PfpI family protein [Halomonas sp. McH1-25]|uniref:DJ-1 family glyoxalase III n=1 Tax=unclassified Halomonas TaxID=2609666 RepID=UPI001EF67A2B|nr:MULTISPECIES: DJ-1 family glyoxalase III [unclassified Halomonas]MCG7598702.1 DJ-1/PfpI family protein [Halomonas sp. McH1-25]MCP1340665.1 DJ-1/PfpI family protein [Halomonas sp. FL8]MCP1359436.1 DJ-1/PfpI family protein [Halomonas sp. BBD45]MCP1365250.1 DJ-1/PfpI family protein [Halomonas sp. BBD48]
MAKVLLPVADGSEDIETVTVIDVLRRAEVDVLVASVMREIEVTLARGTLLTADVTLDAVDESQSFDAIVLPGGMPGASRLRDSETLKERLLQQREAQRWIAAICAAPGVVLAAHDLVRGHDVTGYPAFQAPLADAGGHISQRCVVEDRRLVTSQGPATAMAFALHLVGLLVDEETEARIAEGLLMDVVSSERRC